MGGHEMTATPHVRSDMQARALVSMSTEPSIDPASAAIAALVHDGQHREALTACARTYGSILGRLCMAMLGSQADADEATQETLLRAHRAMPTYRAEGTVKAWLCGIARHVCAHVLETRRKGRELALEIVPPDGGGDELAQRQRSRAIREAMSKLKPTEREALVLRYVGDLTHREIALACNLDEATARKRVNRALARLRSVVPDALFA